MCKFLTAANKIENPKSNLILLWLIFLNYFTFLQSMFYYFIRPFIQNNSVL